MIYRAELMLMVSVGDARGVLSASFDALGIIASDERLVVTRSSFRYRLALAEYPAAHPKVEASEDFEMRLALAYEHACTWLESRPPQLFRELSSRGAKSWLLFAIDMVDNQMEFALPPQLMACASQRNLTLQMISND